MPFEQRLMMMLGERDFALANAAVTIETLQKQNTELQEKLSKLQRDQDE